MSTAQLIDYKNVGQSIAIDVGHTDPHGEKAGLLNRQLFDRAEVLFGIIDPDSIERLKIVADIEIGGAVIIQVAKDGGKTPIAE